MPERKRIFIYGKQREAMAPEPVAQVVLMLASQLWDERQKRALKTGRAASQDCPVIREEAS